MRRIALIFSVALGGALGAQQQQSANDPTVKIKSSGLPAGWSIRLDDKEQRYTVDDTRFEIMGSGYHVTSGPAALYYSDVHRPTGSFTVRASLTQMKAPMHPEAYGVFIGGADLATDRQQYFYLLVRGDGKYMIAHRAAAEVHRIVAWTEHPAVSRQDESGKQSNEVAIQVTADSVHMLVNSQRVRSFARSGLHGFNTDGQAGLRINHSLDVHVGTFDVKKN
jgi:hypothetical protein